MGVGVGEEGEGERAGEERASPTKIRQKNIFSANYYVKFGHFCAKIM